MGRFRFFATTYRDVSADTLEEALKAYKEIRRKGSAPEVSRVRRIEVEDETRGFVPVDRPLRAGDLDAQERPSA
jgi:hypothetical protein